MPMKTMEDLFLHHLQDIYYAEKRILEALPKMAKATKSDELRQAFEKHHEETKGQVARLEKVFAYGDKQPKGETCEAIDGLIVEGEELIQAGGDDDVITAGLLASAQAVEHYEIARYGTLVSWAEMLGYDESVPLLRETLEEEKKTDAMLTKLAESKLNKRAAA